MTLRVVVADDQALVRGGFRLILKAAGIDVVAEAADGAQAVAAVLAHRPDVVLMDVRMPVMDGLAATAEIRALPDPAKADTPILAISANVREDDVARYRQGGIDHVLSKPLRPDSLKAMLAKILGDAPAPVPTQPPAAAATRIAATRSARGASFSRNPLAPARSASYT